jgi:cell division protein FtsI/penicillin-binding protein 2
VEAGQFRQPVLLPGLATVSARPLPAGTDAQLKDMMRDVVTEGTAAGLGLGPGIYAKTGTADIQNQGKPNSWMVAFDPGKDVAIAALVVNAGYGSTEAGPEVKTFLDQYHA